MVQNRHPQVPSWEEDMKRRTLAALLAGVAFMAGLSGGAMAQDKPTMGVVVKIGGIPWFNAMEMGIT